MKRSIGKRCGEVKVKKVSVEICEERAYKVAHTLVAKAAMVNEEQYTREPELLRFRPDYTRCAADLTKTLTRIFSLALVRPETVRTPGVTEKVISTRSTREIDVSTGSPEVDFEEDESLPEIDIEKNETPSADR